MERSKLYILLWSEVNKIIKYIILLILCGISFLMLFSIISSGCPGKHRIIKEKMIKNVLRAAENYILMDLHDQIAEQRLPCITDAVRRIVYKIDDLISSDSKDGYICVNPDNSIWITYLTKNTYKAFSNINVLLYWSVPITNENTGENLFIGYCDGELEHVDLQNKPYWNPVKYRICPTEVSLGSVGMSHNASKYCVYVPLLETLGVVGLAMAGAIFGFWLARHPARVWGGAYLFVLGLVGLVILGRYVPGLEYATPFRWLMLDRREYALMAMICTVGLIPALRKLKNRRLAVLVTLFMALFIGHFSLMPFLLPAFNRAYLAKLQTKLDRHGVCWQQTDYTCGPAAAVTVLRKLGLPADEGEMAILAHTTHRAGTPPDALLAAIQLRYADQGVRCQFSTFKHVTELRGLEPVITVIQFGFLVDHYIVVLQVRDNQVVAADPLMGMRTLSHSDFEFIWRKGGILVTRDRSSAPPATEAITVQ